MAITNFVDVEEIENVQMSNNSGTFDLTVEQLYKFKKEIARLTYHSISAKVGAIMMIATIDGQEHVLYTSTHGQYVEIPSDMVTKNREQLGEQQSLYFKTNGVNFDNYKEESE